MAEDFLNQLRRVNADRYYAWTDGADAGIMFDALELGGEVGELLNIVKKLDREERGWRGSRADPAGFADECADVLICLDKLARRQDVDLEAVTIAKFNGTSDKVGLPHKLIPAQVGQAAMLSRTRIGELLDYASVYGEFDETTPVGTVSTHGTAFSEGQLHAIIAYKRVLGMLPEDWSVPAGRTGGQK